MSAEPYELSPDPEVRISTETASVGTCGHEPPRFGCEACVAAAQPMNPFIDLSSDELDELIDRFMAECVADFGWPPRCQPVVVAFLRERLR